MAVRNVTPKGEQGAHQMGRLPGWLRALWSLSPQEGKSVSGEVYIYPSVGRLEQVTCGSSGSNPLNS